MNASQLDGLAELGLIFGGIGLFLSGARLAQKINSMLLGVAVFFAQFGFLGGACYGERAFLGPRIGWAHFSAVAVGALEGIGVGFGVALLLWIVSRPLGSRSSTLLKPKTVPIHRTRLDNLSKPRRVPTMLLSASDIRKFLTTNRN